MKASTLGLSSLLFIVACSSDAIADEAALRALDDAYVQGWKENTTSTQEKAVLAIFTDDAVIMPGRGLEPQEGIDQLQSFWFSPDYPPTSVHEFDHDITGIDIEDGLGLVRGRYAIRFEYDGAEYARDGSFMFAARRQPDDSWLVTQMIWNDRTLDQ